ncbi:MAG: lactate utilization protein C [bacterium]
MNSGLREKFNLFKSSYEKQSGQVYLATDTKAAIENVEQILAASKSKKAVLAPISKEIEKNLNSFFAKSNFPIVAVKQNVTSVAQQINVADVGICPAEFAIAETGTIVEVTTDDAHRLISSLPRVHIAFLEAAQIVNSLAEAASRLREIYRKYKEYCNITFISGPSRTADIEMKLFLGVHGPQESHVIVCDWQ